MLLLLIILIKDNKYQNWNYPLEINISNDNKSIKIRIDNIDKIRRKEKLESNRKNMTNTNITNTNEENK